MASDEDRDAPRSDLERGRRERAFEHPSAPGEDRADDDEHRDAGSDRELAPPTERLSRRRLWIGGAVVVVAAAAFATCHAMTRFPADTVPEGAYLRIAYSVGRGDVLMVFPYLEDEAQHACFTIRDERKQALDLVDKNYPEPERTRLTDLYRPYATATDGSDVWVDISQKRGFIGKLRRDLSGIAKVETEGERATIETARGTRYAFRRRQNGIWGLTMFTAELSTEAERAARDVEVVKRAAADYERAGK